MKLKVALGQMRVKTGQVQHNVDVVRAMISQAKLQGADIIVFPEMCVSGYFLGDRWYDDALCHLLENMNDTIKNYAKDIIVVWGNLSRSINNTSFLGQDGRIGRFNSVFIAQNQTYVARENGMVYPWIKSHLLNYHIFDDARYFMSSEELKNELHLDLYSPFVVSVKGEKIKLGLETWSDLIDLNSKLNPTKQWMARNVDMIITAAAIPWAMSQKDVIVTTVRAHTYPELKTPSFVVVNAVGIQNSGKNVIGFDGGSIFINATRQQTVRASDDFKPALVMETTPIESGKSKRLQGLINALQCFDEEMFPNKPKWVVGLSGGLDSSITASLLVLAIGSHRVVGVNLATRFNSRTTIANASKLAQALNMEYREGSIEPLLEATMTACNTLGFPLDTSLAQENAQARIRGHVLSSVASSINGIVINSSNKVEATLGYATLYGDTIGAIAPLADCTKVQLFELAHEINAEFKQEVIPNNLIGKLGESGYVFEVAPSAELKEKQVDPMKWGYHDILVSKLLSYPSFQLKQFKQQVLEGTLKDEQLRFWLSAYGLLADKTAFTQDLAWFENSYKHTVYKRIQMPPVVFTDYGALGSDIREVQGNFEEEVV